MSTSSKSKTKISKEADIQSAATDRAKVEYFSQSCCTRNRVNNFFLTDSIDMKLVKVYMTSAFSKLENQ